MRRSAIFGLAAAALVAAASVAVAGSRWQLGFTHDTPSWVRVPGAAGKTKIAWFMTWRVENKTGDERKPVLRMELRGPKDAVFRDTGDPLTKAAAEKKLGKKDLAVATDVRTGLADGAARDGVATFGQVDDEADDLELRVYGLVDPVDEVKGKRFYEVKFWQVKYHRDGDEFRRVEDAWKVVSRGWVVEKRDELPPVER